MVFWQFAVAYFYSNSNSNSFILSPYPYLFLSSLDCVGTNNHIKGRLFLVGQTLCCYLHQSIKRMCRSSQIDWRWKIWQLRWPRIIYRRCHSGHRVVHCRRHITIKLLLRKLRICITNRLTKERKTYSGVGKGVWLPLAKNGETFILPIIKTVTQPYRYKLI